MQISLQAKRHLYIETAPIFHKFTDQGKHQINKEYIS